MRNLLPSNQQTSEVMYGFEESENGRVQEQAIEQKRKFHMRIKFRGFFGVCDQ